MVAVFGDVFVDILGEFEAAVDVATVGVFGVGQDREVLPDLVFQSNRFASV